MVRFCFTAVFAAVALAAFTLAIVTALTVPSASSDIARIDPANAAAFAWIRDHTLPDSTWILLGNGHDFYGNAAEWFPVLTERVALNVMQGREWIGDDGAVTVNVCETADCIRGDEADFIYISGCCAPLAARLGIPVYSAGDVLIFEGIAHENNP